MVPLLVVLFKNAELLQEASSEPPQLARRISCQEAFLPLDRFAMLLEKKTGMRFMASPNVADRKIAISCVDRPVAEVMRAVGEAMFMVWKREGGVYHLVLSPDVKVQEATALESAKAELERGVTVALDVLAEASRLSPEEKDVEARKAIRDVLRLAPVNGEPESAAYKAALARKAVLTAGVQRNLGSLFAGRVKEAAAAITDGRTLVGSSEPLPGALPMSSALLEEISRIGGSASGGKALALVRLARGGEGLMAMGFPTSSQTMSLSQGYIDLRPSLGSVREPGKIERRLEEWSSQRDEAVLRRTLSSASPLTRPPYGLAALSAGEQLLDLSRRSGVPVVADAFRLPCSFAEPFAGSDVQAWLDAFNRPRTIEGFGFEPGYVRSSGGWLMFRNARYVQKLVQEIPERSIERLQGPVGDPKLATVDDYAGFVSSSTPLQLLGLERPLLVGFRRRMTAENKLVLRFWASLSPSQRLLARSKGAPVQDFIPSQLASFRDALGGIAFGGQSSKAYLDLLIKVLRRDAALTDTRVLLSVTAPNPGATEPDFENMTSRSSQPSIVPATWKTALTIATGTPDQNVRIEMSLPSRPYRND